MAVEPVEAQADRNQDEVIHLLEAALDEARGAYDRDKLFGFITSVDFLLVDDAQPRGWVPPSGGRQ